MSTRYPVNVCTYVSIYGEVEQHEWNIVLMNSACRMLLNSRSTLHSPSVDGRAHALFFAGFTFEPPLSPFLRVQCSLECLCGLALLGWTVRRAWWEKKKDSARFMGLGFACTL